MKRWAIVGAGRAGKSSAMLELAQRLSALGWRLGGVAQPSLVQDGRVLGYDLVDLGNGERMPFARKRVVVEAGQLSFAFDESGWQWARQRIEIARQEADLLLVDELGRIEADAGGGHLPALLGELTSESCAHWVLGVRRDRVSALRALLGPFEAEHEAPLDNAAGQTLSEAVSHALHTARGTQSQ